MTKQSETVTRPLSTDLDSILGQTIKVLDEGFIRAMDYMGSDDSIVQAARVSYGKGTKRLHEDRGLIRYLMRHRHTTPFEMCELKLHVRVPMDCWRQWIRHRTANVNEYSTRYSEAINAAQQTQSDRWREQAASNRQGSGEFLDAETGAHLTRRETESQQAAREVYEERLARGVAREQARKDLPLSTYTEAYWKIDLHNLFHFLSLRMDSHAQTEIRSYADIIGHEIVARWCPVAWEAFVDYRLGAVSFTAVDLDVILPLIAGNKEGAIAAAQKRGLIPKDSSALTRNRERSELETKLASLGLSIPWSDHE